MSWLVRLARLEIGKVPIHSVTGVMIFTCMTWRLRRFGFLAARFRLVLSMTRRSITMLAPTPFGPSSLVPTAPAPLAPRTFTSASIASAAISIFAPGSIALVARALGAADLVRWNGRRSLDRFRRRPGSDFRFSRRRFGRRSNA